MWVFWIFPFCLVAVAGQDYVDECPEANGFFADAVQCDRYYECKNGQVSLHTIVYYPSSVTPALSRSSQTESCFKITKIQCYQFFQIFYEIAIVTPQ